MDFAEMAKRLERAGADPQAMAVVSLDILLESRPEAMRRVVEAACIPHWFDEPILAAILDDDLRTQAGEWHRQIVLLPFCEKYRQGKASNVHESTRMGVRARLAETKPDRLRELSARAAAAVCNGSTIQERAEQAFHRLWVDAEDGGRNLRALEVALRHDIEDGLALVATLRECIEQKGLPPLIEGWASWTTCVIRRPYLNLADRFDLAVRAHRCAQEGRSDYALAAASFLLAEVLVERGRPGDIAVAFTHYSTSLALRESMLSLDATSIPAARDVSASLNGLADFLVRRGLAGDAEQALTHLNRSLKINTRLLEEVPDSSPIARDLSVSLNNLAEFLACRGLPGDFECALEKFERSLAIREGLWDANIMSQHAARDVATSFGRLADHLARRGLREDSERALACYERDLEISKRLLALSPDSMQAARDVSASLTRMAGFLTCRGLPGDADRARALLDEGLEVRERLLAANPDSALAARDVTQGLESLGDFLSRRTLFGDAERALGQREPRDEMDERLLAVDTSFAEDKEESSAAQVLQKGASPVDALTVDEEHAVDHLEQRLAVHEKLLTLNPEYPGTERALVVTLNELAKHLAQRGLDGDAERALAYFERSLTVAERLLDSNSTSTEAARDVAVGLASLADFLLRRKNEGDLEQSLVLYNRSLVLLEDVLTVTPESEEAIRDVGLTVTRLTEISLSGGVQPDLDQSVERIRRSLDIGRRLLATHRSFAEAGQDAPDVVNRVAAFLARHDLAHDEERSLAYNERELDISERLLSINPTSAEAARDVSASLDRLGKFLSSRGMSGDTDRAQRHYERSLEIRNRLLAANPEFGQAARDVCVSHWTLFHFHRRLGDRERSRESLAACFRILDDFAGGNRPMDAKMRMLHAKLKPMFKA